MLEYNVRMRHHQSYNLITNWIVLTSTQIFNQFPRYRQQMRKHINAYTMIMIKIWIHVAEYMIINHIHKHVKIIKNEIMSIKNSDYSVFLSFGRYISVFHIHAPDVFKTFPFSISCCALPFFFNLSYGFLKNKTNL